MEKDVVQYIVQPIQFLDKPQIVAGGEGFIIYQVNVHKEIQRDKFHPYDRDLIFIKFLEIPRIKAKILEKYPNLLMLPNLQVTKAEWDYWRSINKYCKSVKIDWT